MDILERIFGKDADLLWEGNFQVLLLANLLAPLGSGLMSAVLNSLADPFAVSTADLGLMISAFTAPAVLIIPITGVLADRFGRKPVLVAGLLTFGVGGVAIAFTNTFEVALALRLMQGVGYAGITPIIITSIGDLYAGTKETTAQGLRFACSGFAQTVFPILSGILVVIAWQYPFFIYAIAFPVAVIVWLRFEEPAASLQSPANDGEQPTSRSGREQFAAVWDLISEPRVQLAILVRGLPVMVWIGFLTYNSVFVERLMGGTPAEAGLLTAIGSITYAGASSQAGRVTALFDDQLKPLLGAHVAMGIGFTAVVFSPSVAVAGPGIVLMCIGFGLALSLYRSIVTSLTDVTLRGSVVSLSESFGRLLSTVTPVLMGAIIALSTPIMGGTTAIRAAGIVIALIVGLGGVLTLLVVNATTEILRE